MKTLDKFPFSPDKKRVLSAIDCVPGNPVYHRASLCFDRVINKFYAVASPRAAYSFEAKSALLDFLPDCSEVIYVLYTLGSSISYMINKNFQDGDYLEGTILSAMADVYLFQAREWLYEYLKNICMERSLQLSRCFAPFDDIEPSYQRQIVDKLPIGVTLTSAFMLQPVKSASFILGVGKNIQECVDKHYCESCNRLSCSFRYTAVRLNP